MWWALNLEGMYDRCITQHRCMSYLLKGLSLVLLLHVPMRGLPLVQGLSSISVFALFWICRTLLLLIVRLLVPQRVISYWLIKLSYSAISLLITFLGWENDLYMLQQSNSVVMLPTLGYSPLCCQQWWGAKLNTLPFILLHAALKHLKQA